MKLSPVQREALALLKLTDTANAATLGVPFKTLNILHRSGCVAVARVDEAARNVSVGIHFAITDKGRGEVRS